MERLYMLESSIEEFEILASEGEVVPRVEKKNDEIILETDLQVEEKNNSNSLESLESNGKLKVTRSGRLVNKPIRFED